MAAVSRPEPSAGLEGLLATWQAWNRRDVLARAADRAADAGDTERAAALHALLDGQEAPSATAALAAQHELASQVEGWRWQTVAAARAEGATSDDVAAATGTTADAARTDHVQQVERAEAAALAAGLEFDHDRYRLDADELQNEPDRDEPAASAQEASMSESTDDHSGATAARIEDLRAAIAAREESAEGEVDGQQRSEQLARWHDEDHRVTDVQQEMPDDGAGEPGWTR